MTDEIKAIKTALSNLKNRNTNTVKGCSDNKGDPNYFLDLVREMWNDLDIDTDTEEIRWILNWFDKKRELLALKDIYISPDAKDIITFW